MHVLNDHIDATFYECQFCSVEEPLTKIKRYQKRHRSDYKIFTYPLETNLLSIQILNYKLN